MSASGAAATPPCRTAGAIRTRTGAGPRAAIVPAALLYDAAPANVSAVVNRSVDVMAPKIPPSVVIVRIAAA